MPAWRSQSADALHQVEGLHAADRLLHLRRGVLHAEARARDADRGQRARQRFVEPARVELDGVLLQARQVEQRGEPRGDRLQPMRPQDRGRAAAPMQMGELAAAQGAEQRDLVEQALGVGLDRLAPAHGVRIAAAIEAQLGAERHVDVKREARLVRQRREPVGIGRWPDGGGEMRRGRVGGVARHVALGERERFAHGFGRIRHCAVWHARNSRAPAGISRSKPKGPPRAFLAINQLAARPGSETPRKIAIAGRMARRCPPLLTEMTSRRRWRRAAGRRPPARPGGVAAPSPRAPPGRSPCGRFPARRPTPSVPSARA